MAYQDWEKKEDEVGSFCVVNGERFSSQHVQFYLKQAKDAAENRIKQGRAKPIDILYKNLNMDVNFDFDMNEPYKIFKVIDWTSQGDLPTDLSIDQPDYWLIDLRTRAGANIDSTGRTGK